MPLCLEIGVRYCLKTFIGKKKKEPAQEGRKEEKREERRKKEEWKNIFILIANLQRNSHLSLSSIALIMLHFLILL